jgi:predicted DNA-binding transcriptional regulator YafY
VLPSRLGRRVDALQGFTEQVTGGRGGPTVDAPMLAMLAAACRDRERVRFGYLDREGSATSRAVEPQRLVNWGRRWYLLAWDVDRDDWRTFRVDRIEQPTGVGLRFAARESPGGDAAAYVRKGSTRAWAAFTARILVNAPAAEIAEKLSHSADSVEVVDDAHCLLTISAAGPSRMAPWLGFLGYDFTVLDSPELIAELRALATRFQSAAPA